MAPSLIKVRPEDCDYPSQPRSSREPEYCRSLGENMKSVGQQVPVIGYTDPVTRRFVLEDGGCRAQGAILCGIPELLALDLGKAPTPLELAMAQASIDIQKKHFPAMDRARLWQSIIKQRGCTAKQLAKELGVSDSLVGDYLSLLTLPADVQEQVSSGALHMSKACFIAQQEGDPDRQRELAALAKDLSRSQLAAKAKAKRRNGQNPEAPAVVRVSRIKCPLPSGAVVQVSGEEINLDDMIEAMAELVKQAKRASEQGLDVRTFERVCKDRAKK